MERRGFIFCLGATLAVARVAPLMRLEVPKQSIVFDIETCNEGIESLNAYSSRILYPAMNLLAKNVIEDWFYVNNLLQRKPLHALS